MQHPTWEYSNGAETITNLCYLSQQSYEVPKGQACIQRILEVTTTTSTSMSHSIVSDPKQSLGSYVCDEIMHVLLFITFKAIHSKVEL